MTQTNKISGPGLGSLLFLILFLIACSPQIKPDPYTLVLLLKNEPGSLNRLTAGDAYESMINAYTSESLIGRDNQTLEIIPKLALSWEVSADQLTYTFHLRPGVTWHDGQPFTADDVVYTFERIMDPKVKAPHLKVYYKDLKSVEKLDDYTVRFTYSIPYYKALEFCGGIPVVPKHIFNDGQDFNQHPASRAPIGTGPFRFVKWETGRRIILERNENYWDKSRFPEIKKVVFRVITEDVIALQELKNHRLDALDLRPIQWVRQTNSEQFLKNFTKLEYYEPMYRYVGWNLRRPYFQDKRVRQALTRLINREAIVKKLEFGLGELISGPFYFKGYEYNPRVPLISYDPEAAKKLLDEAGWIDRDGDGIRDKDGLAFSFTLLIRAGNPFYEKLGTLMKEDLEKVGIRMEIQRLEFSVCLERIQNHDFDATSMAWTFGPDQDPYQVWHSSQKDEGSNFIGFENAEADHLMEEARKTFDRSKRTELYQRFHEIVAEEQPYTFLFTPATLSVHSNRFDNVKTYPLGYDPLEWRVKAE